MNLFSLKRSSINGFGVFAEAMLKAGDSVNIKKLQSNPNFGGFNHSCDCNCLIGKGDNIFLLKNISPGEEMTVSYTDGIASWTAEERLAACNCPSCARAKNSIR